MYSYFLSFPMQQVVYVKSRKVLYINPMGELSSILYNWKRDGGFFLKFSDFNYITIRYVFEVENYIFVKRFCNLHLA